MSNEIYLAFAHPKERSEASEAETVHDRISLRDHIVDVEIGAFQSERGNKQRVCFNIVVEVKPFQNKLEDDVDRILSYDKVTEAITTELSVERLNLLETLAERISDRILSEPQAIRVFVRIEKLDRGPGALGVEIVRSNEMKQVRSMALEDIRLNCPKIIVLSNKAFESVELKNCLDELERLGRSAIFCVGLPSENYSKVTQKQVQRRIDLLAIEQNAWKLAAYDKRCVVVETKTELDWAIKNGQISVWAPAKMLLDAKNLPNFDLQNPLPLSEWLANEFGTQYVTWIGDITNTNCSIKIETIPLG
ncbi:dihydroneopterin aldolase [Paracoccaceae bacterium]|nr:dihydroneopterin aldolase [Paracoccaceae bacterium]